MQAVIKYIHKIFASIYVFSNYLIGSQILNKLKYFMCAF